MADLPSPLHPRGSTLVRYFFHVHDGVSVMDAEGTELPDLRAARREAVRLTGRLLQDDDEQFWNGENWHLDVADDTGLILFSLYFMAVDAPAVAPGHAQAMAAARSRMR